MGGVDGRCWWGVLEGGSWVARSTPLPAVLPHCRTLAASPAQVTAHLTDFETSRAIDGASIGASGLQGTRRYLAPEMRCEPPPPPSAAADMYAYGVCTLLTCCAEGACAFSPTGALVEWRRAAAAAAVGDAAKEYAHLAALLESVLLGAPAERAGAAEALHHPFLDAALENQITQREHEELEARVAWLAREESRRQERHEQEERAQQQRLEEAERQARQCTLPFGQC